MAKIVTIQLLINGDTKAECEEIARKTIEALSSVEQVMDAAQIGLPAAPSDSVQNALMQDTYTSGLAFTPVNANEAYLLVMRGDVDPYLQGPYESDPERLLAARKYRTTHGDDDGLYRIDQPRGIPCEIDCFSGGELETENRNYPLWNFVLNEFRHRRTPITVSTVNAAEYYAVVFNGEEFILTLDFLESIEDELNCDLVEVVVGNKSGFVPQTQAQELFTEANWKIATAACATRRSYADWATAQAAQLPKARDVLLGNAPQH